MIIILNSNKKKPLKISAEGSYFSQRAHNFIFWLPQRTLSFLFLELDSHTYLFNVLFRQRKSFYPKIYVRCISSFLANLSENSVAFDNDIFAVQETPEAWTILCLSLKQNKFFFFFNFWILIRIKWLFNPTGSGFRLVKVNLRILNLEPGNRHFTIQWKIFAQLLF